MSPKYKKYNQSDPLQLIVVGLFRLLWWIATLPFKGLVRGKKKGLSLNDRNYLASKRQEIERLTGSQSEIELKHAVMEADKLVDYAFKAKGFAGETFADRLRSAQSSLNPALYNELWQGHKVRNQIAHEQGVSFSDRELKEAVTKLLMYLRAL